MKNRLNFKRYPHSENRTVQSSQPNQRLLIRDPEQDKNVWNFTDFISVKRSLFRFVVKELHIALLCPVFNFRVHFGRAKSYFGGEIISLCSEAIQH